VTQKSEFLNEPFFSSTHKKKFDNEEDSSLFQKIRKIEGKEYHKTDNDDDDIGGRRRWFKSMKEVS
jgi:hypothetical protein